MVSSPGRNPARRSRKIGTSAQGFKKRNAFAIPTRDGGLKRFYESLVKPVELKLSIGRHSFVVLVEPVLTGFKYHVSLTDLIEVLKLIPEADRRDIKIVVFRQPKRKERIFSPVWGRMAYWADYGDHTGTAVVIEAQPLDYRYRLDTSIGPNFARELDSLRGDGHHIETGKRHIDITCPPEAIRNTQLFRTLPHEIGHNVDYLTKVDQADGDYDALRTLYFARPQSEREAFADRYAETIMAPFRENAIIPFPPLKNREDSGLNLDWFHFDSI